MSVKKGFQVDQRVGIAMDALSASQKAALKPVLQSKKRFVAHSHGHLGRDRGKRVSLSRGEGSHSGIVRMQRWASLCSPRSRFSYTARIGRIEVVPTWRV